MLNFVYAWIVFGLISVFPISSMSRRKGFSLVWRLLLTILLGPISMIVLLVTLTNKQ